jgi:hypothetical protein
MVLPTKIMVLFVATPLQFATTERVLCKALFLVMHALATLAFLAALATIPRVGSMQIYVVMEHVHLLRPLLVSHAIVSLDTMLVRIAKRRTTIVCKIRVKMEHLVQVLLDLQEVTIAVVHQDFLEHSVKIPCVDSIQRYVDQLVRTRV